MKFMIRVCPKCFKYTLKLKCKLCSNETKLSHPSKFSPDDKYLKYRMANKLN